MSDALSAGSPERFGYEWPATRDPPGIRGAVPRLDGHLSPDDWRAKAFSMSDAARAQHLLADDLWRRGARRSMSIAARLKSRDATWPAFQVCPSRTGAPTR